MVKHVLKDGKLIPIGGEPSTSELRGTSTYAPRVRTNNSYFTNIPNVTDIVVNPGHRPYKCDICEYSVNDLHKLMGHKQLIHKEKEPTCWKLINNDKSDSQSESSYNFQDANIEKKVDHMGDSCATHSENAEVRQTGNIGDVAEINRSCYLNDCSAPECDTPEKGKDYHDKDAQDNLLPIKIEYDDSCTFISTQNEIPRAILDMSSACTRQKTDQSGLIDYTASASEIMRRVKMEFGFTYFNEMDATQLENPNTPQSISLGKNPSRNTMRSFRSEKPEIKTDTHQGEMSYQQRPDNYTCDTDYYGEMDFTKMEANEEFGSCITTQNINPVMRECQTSLKQKQTINLELNLNDSGVKEHNDFEFSQTEKDGNKSNQCDICGYVPHNPGYLKVHRMIHTGEKPLQCDLCNYSTAHPGYLKAHKTKHDTSQRRYKCGLCEFTTSNSTSLKKHMLIHTGEKPYKCDVCEFSCAQEVGLKKHKMIHTGEKPYKCDFCDYRSTHMDHLRSHVMRHTGEKPHKCELCNYSTAWPSRLKTHMMKHTGLKPYKCAMCDFTTTQSGLLKTHVLRHTGEKPYMCELCDFRTTQAGNLKRHMRTHTGEKPYKCYLCDYSAVQSVHLKKHINTKHPLEITD